MATKKNMVEALPRYLYVGTGDFTANVASLSTGISTVGNQVMKVIGFDWQTVTVENVAADAFGLLSLTAGSSISNLYVNPETIYVHSISVPLTTSGSPVIPTSGSIRLAEPFYVVLGQISVYCLWFGVGSCSMRIHYENEAVSELDLLRMIQSQ
jgi:hypothetical protein